MILCESSICVNMQFPLYAVAMVGSFLMVLSNRLEENEEFRWHRRKFFLHYAELLLAAAVLLSIGDFLLMFVVPLPSGIAASIAEVSIGFTAVSVALIFSSCLIVFYNRDIIPIIIAFKKLKKSLFPKNHKK